MNGVAHLGHFRKHHRATRAHDQVGRKAHRRVGCHARKRIAAAALHPDHEIGCRTGFALALVQVFQAALGHLHDGIGHADEAVEGFVLQTQHRRIRRAGHFDRNAATRRELFRHKAFGHKLFAAQADHHDLAAKVGIERQVLQRADRHDGGGRVDGDAAAVHVVERDHVADIREARQQFAFDAAHDVIRHARHALHACHDAEHVLRADRAISIAIALEGIALQLCQLRVRARGQRQFVQRGGGRQLHGVLIDPATARQRLHGVTDHLVVADDRVAFSQVDQRHLVALGHTFD